MLRELGPPRAALNPSCPHCPTCQILANGVGLSGGVHDCIALTSLATTDESQRSNRVVQGMPFGRYQLLDLLGRGGMGEVWRTFDTVTERVVALKQLPRQFADDPVFQERFRREARAAAGLNEPHVIPIFDFGEIDSQLFITMRLIEGEDLQAIIDHGPLEPAASGQNH